MIKKSLFLFFAVVIIFSIGFFTLPAEADDQVCGVDGINYNSADAAEEAGIEVSYEFSCVNPTSEEGLYEEENDINFAGMLVEVGSTDIPTTLIIRDNSDNSDYTVEVTEDTILGQKRDQTTNLSDWIPGDQIRVIGKKNENTGTVEATILVNLSIKLTINNGANGWITNINKDAKTITYQWANKEHTFAYGDDTRFVSGLTNPAAVDDLAVNDRIRARLLIRSGEISLAKIIVVLRRGSDLFMKIRTFRPNATLVRLDSAIVPTTIQVKIEATAGLRANDVNNLIGIEGALVTVNVTEDTKLVRKYFGRVTLDEFSIGDKLHIVGRVNDDGTIDAKMIKDNSIWKTSTLGYAAVVTKVNIDESYIIANWTPVNYLTRKKLKEKLDEVDNSVTAQTTAIRLSQFRLKLGSLTDRLRNRIQNVEEKIIGKFTRNIKYKKVEINRIKHNNLKIGDLIKRQPVKKMRIDINSDTKIVVGINENAAIADIQAGDKVRIRGIRHATLPLISAEVIVVVNSLPEIDTSEDIYIDDVNEIVSEIVTNDGANAIVEDTASDTEEEISNEETEDCVSEGAMCGGIAGLICCSELTCDYDGDYPDASGTCVK